jgi:hypothetical protein
MYQVANDRVKPYHRGECQAGTSLTAVRGGGWRRHFRVFDGKKARHHVPRSWPAMAWSFLALVGAPLAAGLMS